MSGPISTRLGLTLYELLAVRPAFEAEDRHALIRQVTQGEPRPCARSSRRFPATWRRSSRRPSPGTPTTATTRPRIFATSSSGSWPTGRSALGRSRRRSGTGGGASAIRLLALATSAACALMIAIAVVSTVAAYRNGRLADQLKAQRDEANRNLIHAYTNEAEARRHGRRVGQRFEAFDAIARAMQLARPPA